MKNIHGLTAGQWLERINSPQAKDWPRNIGHDKGWSPSSYVFLVYDPEMDILVVAKELVCRGYISEREVQELKEINKGFTHPFTTCTDPPDHPRDTREMNHRSREHDARIYFKVLGQYDTQEKEVQWGIGLVSNFIAKGKFVVLGDDCPELVENLQTYHLKESNAKVGPDKTADDTHLPDALRYGVVGMHSQIEIARKKHKKEQKAKAGRMIKKVAGGVEKIPPPDIPERLEEPKPKPESLKPKLIKTRKMIHVRLR